MIRIKRGVDISNLNPQMCVALQIVHAIYREEFKAECVITSGRDGNHTHVLHYVGQALDFRVRHLLSGDRARVEPLVQNALGEQYDAVLKESVSPCLHVEFDPR